MNYYRAHQRDTARPWRDQTARSTKSHETSQTTFFVMFRGSRLTVRLWTTVLLSLLSFLPTFAQQPPQKAEDLPARTIPKAKSVQKEVSFQTQDGWRIYGTYTVPETHRQGQKLPAALLLHSPAHSQIVWGVYPGWIKIQESIATLRIDLRGRGKSEGSSAFVDFNQKQREAVAFDIKAALDFLSAQSEVEPRHLGIVAEGFSADPALIAAGIQFCDTKV